MAGETVKREVAKVLRLKRPIDFGTEHIEELSFRRGRLGDLEGLQVSEMLPVADLIVVASRLAGQPQAVIKLLDEEDSGEVIQYAAGFIARSLLTGGTA